jgi:phosphoribosylglycinamide formyltransferase-1
LFKIVVLVSGGGSNLQAIIDAIAQHQLNAEITTVISSSSKAYALERAKLHNILTYVVTKKEFDDPNAEILKILSNQHIDLIVLAGYLGILSGELLRVYKNKIINIHPALLPKFGGSGMYGHFVHEAVLKAKEKESGCTVHYVTDKIDQGKIIMQAKVNVLDDDTPETLAKRILVEEHKLLPKAIQSIIDKTKQQ